MTEENMHVLIESFASGQTLANYKDIDLNSLICYAVHLLEINRVPRTFENISACAFVLFPEKFQLLGYPKYPDCARTNRAIMQCLPKYRNYMVGKAKTGYKLTSFGERQASDVKQLLEQSPTHGSSERVVKNISQRTVNHDAIAMKLREKTAFAKFLRGDEESIGTDEIFEFIEASPFDHRKVIREKIMKLEEVAKYGDSPELQNFIRWINKNKEFKAYLAGV